LNESFVIYVWKGMKNVALISTENATFSQAFQVWAELEGYRVEIKKAKVTSGFEHQ